MASGNADMLATNWIDRFEQLRGLKPECRALLLGQSQVANLPAGQVVFGPGLPADNLLLLLDGTVRVQQRSESGREIVLYRVEAGESCVMTTSCLLSHENYSAEGVTESDIRAAIIPRAVFDQLLAISEPFRSLVFNSYAERIGDLFRVIDDVAFGRIDIRLAQRLVELARGTGAVQATHQQLATELGTAREVVSRQLTEFQKRGLVSLSRGVVTLQDVDALRALGQN